MNLEDSNMLALRNVLIVKVITCPVIGLVIDIVNDTLNNHGTILDISWIIQDGDGGKLGTSKPNIHITVWRRLPECAIKLNRVWLEPFDDVLLLLILAYKHQCHFLSERPL